MLNTFKNNISILSLSNDLKIMTPDSVADLGHLWASSANIECPLPSTI